jgi:hypothetical protein
MLARTAEDVLMRINERGQVLRLAWDERVEARDKT